jgi:hypothetical protein
MFSLCFLFWFVGSSPYWFLVSGGCVMKLFYFYMVWCFSCFYVVCWFF